MEPNEEYEQEVEQQNEQPDGTDEISNDEEKENFEDEMMDISHNRSEVQRIYIPTQEFQMQTNTTENTTRPRLHKENDKRKSATEEIKNMC